MKQLAERLVSLTGWSRWAVSATMGVALGMAHTPFGIWPLAFVAGAVLCLQWRAGGGFAVGWAAGAAFFAVTLHWIVEPFLVDAARYGWMAPFALVLMAGGLALFWGAAFWIAGYFRRAGIAALALCWAVGEALRGGIFTGFPWALPAYIWLDTPIAQLASILGPYGLSLITLLAITGLGAGTVKWAAPVILLAGIGAWVWGDFRQGDGLTAATDTTVRIIQPNIPQAQKWDASFARQNFERTLALTSADASNAARPDIVIWPEVAVPFAIEQEANARAEIAQAAGGAHVILGSLARSPNAPRWRNALIALNPLGQKQARYDKAHLVPFGEYMPFSDLMERIGVLALAGRGAGMEAGLPPRPIALPGLPAFTPLICYEGIFPREVRSGTAGADWIVLITNDAWFGQWAGPAQHLAQARMRAIESGLPVARAANTGISAMISPYGRIIEAASLNERKYLDVSLPAAAPKTVYSQFGATVAILVTFLTLLIGVTFFSVPRLRKRLT